MMMTAKMVSNNSLHIDIYRRKSSETLDAAIAMTAEGNQVERDLNSQLIILSTVFIGATSAILAGGIFADSSTFGQAVAAALSVFSALAGIGFGIVNYFREISFFIESSKKYTNLSNLYEQAEVAAHKADGKAHTEVVVKIKKLSDEFGSRTNQKFLKLEVACLTISGVSLLALIAAIVGDWSEVSQEFMSLLLR